MEQDFKNNNDLEMNSQEQEVSHTQGDGGNAFGEGGFEAGKTFSAGIDNIYEQAVGMDGGKSNETASHDGFVDNDKTYSSNPYEENSFAGNTGAENYHSQDVPPQQNNYFVQPVYQVQNPYPEVDTSKDGICMASFILGIVGFFINPIYIVSILAIVFGAMGMGSQSIHANKAKIGLILGIVSIALQICVDLILTIFTAGIGSFSCCC